MASEPILVALDLAAVRRGVLARGNSIGLGKISTESGYRNRFGNLYIFDCSRV
jgi:hypothetical protein